ncbi:MAG: hypothetical protein MZU91_11395 [Desulfosudis oleivorans]|nr:hypothetical protein [Desulfosudis oleivorans]
MSNKLGFSLLLAFCVMASFAAASASRTGAGSANTPDPCNLLTKQEIQDVIGQPVGDGKPNMNANAAIGRPCEFKVGDYGVFSLLVKAAGPGENAKAGMAQLSKMGTSATEIAGLGDGAFYFDAGYGMLSLNTFKGSTYLIIAMLVPGMGADTQQGLRRKADAEGPGQALSPLSVPLPRGLAPEGQDLRGDLLDRLVGHGDDRPAGMAAVELAGVHQLDPHVFRIGVVARRRLSGIRPGSGGAPPAGGRSYRGRRPCRGSRRGQDGRRVLLERDGHVGDEPALEREVDAQRGLERPRDAEQDQLRSAAGPRRAGRRRGGGRSPSSRCAGNRSGPAGLKRPGFSDGEAARVSVSRAINGPMRSIASTLRSAAGLDRAPAGRRP